MSFVGAAVSIALVAGLLALLYAIVRFSIISPAKTRGAANRLRSPQADGIGAIVGFAPSPALVGFYREAPFIESIEFYLVDRSKTPPAVWPIGAFSPLTPQDVRENRTVVPVDGIPIADDMDKGTYYVTNRGAVRLWSPDVPANDVEVAPTISSFLGFERRDEWPAVS